MNTQNDVPETMDFNKVVEYTGLSPVYIRKSISKGKLIPSSKEPINSNPNHFKYMFKRETVDAWRSQSSNHGRSDGRNKYTVYCNSGEYKDLTSKFPELEIKRSNPSKNFVTES